MSMIGDVVKNENTGGQMRTVSEFGLNKLLSRFEQSRVCGLLILPGTRL